MNENREITTSWRSQKRQGVRERTRVEGCELFESWVQAFLDIYATYARRVENPRIAICDYLENGVVDEFHIYADLFRQRGVECVVADVREWLRDRAAAWELRASRTTASASIPVPASARRRRRRWSWCATSKSSCAWATR